MTNETNLPRGTSAHQPDLNWSQVRETVLMLELSAVQIEAAMKDSNASVEVLTDSFTTMAGYMRMISDTVQSLPDQGDVGAAKQNLIGVSEHVSSMVHQAIIAFQFYDKLVQRLAHVGMGKPAIVHQIKVFDARGNRHVRGRHARHASTGSRGQVHG
jgi:hypothetical protein